MGTLPGRKGKHEQELPTLRKIRRTCNKELYRTVKRLNMWIPPERIAEGEKLYLRKVIGHLLWISENGSNRRLLADWWAEHVAPELAALWQVDEKRLSEAFRDGFGG